jgi:hypothetical protein
LYSLYCISNFFWNILEYSLLNLLSIGICCGSQCQYVNNSGKLALKLFLWCTHYAWTGASFFQPLYTDKPAGDLLWTNPILLSYGLSTNAVNFYFLLSNLSLTILRIQAEHMSILSFCIHMDSWSTPLNCTTVQSLIPDWVSLLKQLYNCTWCLTLPMSSCFEWGMWEKDRNNLARSVSLSIKKC